MQSDKDSTDCALKSYDFVRFAIESPTVYGILRFSAYRLSHCV